MRDGTGQFAMSPGGDGTAVCKAVWMLAGHQLAKVPDTIKTAYRRTATGYFIEMMLPGAELGLKQGAQLNDIAVDLVLDDLDGKGQQAVRCRLSLSQCRVWREKSTSPC